ncbi:hypothetical protein [Brevibacillus parabrevis]|uniref:Uncharacterized protein n=1 Tax=Brevibacillus parabrevis TaxID=54914 RepID=A0A4Y3PIV7_BREPA|nr:hypothetical protein BPA01_29540 [Brevibacillus parabrevis]
MDQLISARTIASVEIQPWGKITAYWSATFLLAATVMASGIGQLMQAGEASSWWRSLVARYRL